jgi:hypothetical protein
MKTNTFENRYHYWQGGLKARSSGGERYLDAVEVWGSNPHVPTIETNLLKSET